MREEATQHLILAYVCVRMCTHTHTHTHTHTFFLKKNDCIKVPEKYKNDYTITEKGSDTNRVLKSQKETKLKTW